MRYIPLITGFIILVMGVVCLISTWLHNNRVLREYRNPYNGTFFILFMAIYAIALGVVVIYNT